MFLSDLAIAKPVAAIMVTFALIIFGLISYADLGVETNPDVEFPFLSVTTVYPGADPETVESEVTDKIEDAVATISGIKNLTSTSAENISLVFIEFELEVELDVAAQDVRDKMAQVQRSLPNNAEMPVVEKFDINAFPIMSIAVGGDVAPQDMARYVDEVIKPSIESIEGVGSVNISGLREREIHIWLDADRMAALEINPQDVVGAVQVEHVELPGGRIETGEREYIVVTSGELETVEAFNDLVVINKEGTLIRIRDVATVEDGLEDLRSIARLNGEPAIGISIVKKSGANTIEVADNVYEAVAEIKAIAPPGLDITIPQDDSIYIRDSFEEVQGHLYGGGLIAIIIVLLFLGNLRSTLIAAIAIPTSIITTYIFMKFLGFTLNNVTMLAFTLMVGMLIDDAIVVLENIYRHTEMGKGPLQAAKEGTKEIAFAVLATTMTILAVFIPVAFMSGIVGRFMYQYGVTVAVGAITSYFVAITLGPMLASVLMKEGGGKDNFFVFRWFDRGFHVVERGYRWLIGVALRQKFLTIIIAIASMIAASFLFTQTKQEFFSSSDFSSTTISIEMPLGTSLQSLIEFTKPLEEIISGIPEVENIYTRLGSGMFGEQNAGSIYVDLVDKTERDRTQWDIEDEIRELFKDIPGAKIVVGAADHMGSSYQYSIEIKGTDVDVLQALAGEILLIMSESNIFRETDISTREGKPEVRIEIDRDRAGELGIDALNIGSTLRLLVSGEDTIATFQEEGRQYDIKMRLDSVYRDRPEDLTSLLVFDHDDVPIEISSFASVAISSGASAIEHSDKLRSILVQGNLRQGNTVGDAVQVVETQLDTLLPPGYSARSIGEAEMMAESFESMGFTLMLAIILIFMIMAAQFNHFIHPWSIMSTLPMSFIGAFGLLYITNMTVNIFSLIGIIMLMGLVTKNAILVVEFTNQLRRRGMERDEALLTAGPIRLRPVIMTALSTIGGMLPVALMIGGGAGVEMRAPMAVAVIGGMLTSTLLSLIVVPVVYALFDTFSNWVLRIFRIKGPVEEELHLPDDQISED